MKNNLSIGIPKHETCFFTGFTLKRIKINAETCAGCRQCEMVCSFTHTKEFSPSNSRIVVHKDDRNGLDYPVLCHQCAQCPPVEVCPTKAITTTSEGWKYIDSQKCIACGLCINACKFDAIKLKEKAIVCNLCNGDPECVKRCPTTALQYIETPESSETPEKAFQRLREMWGFE